MTLVCEYYNIDSFKPGCVCMCFYILSKCTHNSFLILIFVDFETDIKTIALFGEGCVFSCFA